MTTRRNLLSAAVAVTAMLATGDASAQKKGGEIVVGMYVGANSIDPHFSASYPARTMLYPIYETLFTVDETGAPIPLLAEGLTVSPDGLVYDFRLRQGVTFHNGKTMTAADVKASLERYARFSPDKISFAPVTAIETPEPYRVVIRLKELSPSFLDRLASPTSPTSIIPAEQAERELNKTDNIGTGPYRFGEWVPDSHMLLVRHDGYAPDTRAAGPDGFGGRKTAWADRVRLRFLPEASARVAALESGQVHIIEDLPPPTAKRLATNARLAIETVAAFQMPVVYLNHANGPTANLGVRRAIQAALDMDEVMLAASGGVHKLNHAWVYDGNPFHNDAGKALYNINDPARAKQILRESGYKGEPILFNVATIAWMQRVGVVVAEQLKAVGLNVEIRSMDWPTLASMANGNEGWNLATSGFGSQPFVGAWSYQRLFQGEFNLARATNDRKMEEAWGRFNTSLDLAARKAAWRDIQAHSYDNVHVVKLGDMGMTHARAAQLKGFRAYAGSTRIWDVWLD
jgi:peptide/nickel transport system substrate-binding protein